MRLHITSLLPWSRQRNMEIVHEKGANARNISVKCHILLVASKKYYTSYITVVQNFDGVRLTENTRRI